jgi:hypothetical protein
MNHIPNAISALIGVQLKALRGIEQFQPIGAWM